MQNKRIHYIFAAISFLVALFTFTYTMQPSIPFWDCGEFLAAAQNLGVTHPPGDPTWTLVGHVAHWLAPFTDPAARYNFLSALCGALSVMLLYLITVRVIKLWRGEPQTMSDIIVHFGGALIAALCFTWTDSLWFNSVEFIVFSPGLILIMVILWLGMIWHEKADQPGNERYLMLIAYLIGFSIGAHQMSMLAFFPIWMIVYYKHWPKTTVGGWIWMVVSGTLAFLYIYRIVLTGVVDWGTVGVMLFTLALIGGVVYTTREKRPIGNMLLWGASLIFLGYTTYALLMVRGVQDPPMDQHRPTTLPILREYIAREQFGTVREWPRRDDRQKDEPIHAPTWDESKYTGEWDFFWKYQTDHMYIRYLLWNFIGRNNDNQDAPTDWTHTLGIPFFIGLFGMFWHFRRDPKRALAFFAAFFIMGLVTVWFQNQQDAQPRERDYFYVGSFAVYAMWVGIGVTGIMEWLRVRFAKKQNLPMQAQGPNDREVLEREGETVPVIRGEGPMGALGGVLALAVVLIPLNQCLGLAGMTLFGENFHQAAKWGEYSRRHNNFPLEYAYNILQSCDKDGILFTAGDNDTFPLWCIQDLYGVRTDVRIVNLSLGNMGWYIKQLKDQHPWGAKTINLPSFTEAQLAQPDETPQGIRSFIGKPTDVTVNVSADAMARFTGVSQPSSFTWNWVAERPYEGGQYIYQIADQLVKDIVVNNINDRPIYFAAEVSPSYWDGLDGHVIFEGLSGRVVPNVHSPAHGLLDGDIDELKYTQIAYATPSKIETTPVRGMICNSFRDPEANRSALDDHYGTSTYLQLYGRLANYMLNHGRNADAKRALDTLDARVPPSLVSWDYNLLQAIGQLYHAAGDEQKSKKYIVAAAKQMSVSVDANAGANSDQSQYLQNEFAKADLYMSAEWFDSARAIYSGVRPMVEGVNQQFVDFRIGQIDAKLLEKKGDKKGALTKVNELLAKYQSLAQAGAGKELAAVALERDRLANELGAPDSAQGRPAPQIPPTKDALKVRGADSAGKTPATIK